MRKSSPIDSNAIEFKAWLSQHHGYSDRVCSDMLSRCRRIELEVVGDFRRWCKDESSCRELMMSIQEYGENNSEKTADKRMYSLPNTLKLAAKRYAVFINPNLASFFEKNQYARWL